jgi:APA family basic amino acid/polyamine antiporter
VPGVPVIPLLSIIASLVLIVSLPWITMLRFLIWLALGIIIYFAYSISHSHLAHHREE